MMYMRPTHITPHHLRHQASGGIQQRARQSIGAIYRGVVLETYLPGDPRLVGKVSVADPSALPGVVCDVMLIEPRNRTILKKVSVAKLSSGLNDGDVYVPTPSSKSINGGQLLVSAEGNLTQRGLLTRATDFDGDFVIVGFMANDLNQPIILGQIEHPRTNIRPQFTDATKYKRRTVVRGASFGVTNGGDVEVDLRATGGETTPSGALVSDPLTGNLDIRLKTAAAVTINGGGTPERTILGETLLTDLQASLTEIQTALAGLGIPLPNTAVLIGKITTSLSAGAPLLSNNLKTD